jgi:hypothetical protein
MQQVPSGGPADIRRYGTKFSLHGHLGPGICEALFYAVPTSKCLATLQRIGEPSSSRPDSPKNFLGVPDPENKGAIFVRNVANHLPIDQA